MSSYPKLRVAALGAGLIGGSWARLFVQGGHAVVLWDPDAKRARAVAADIGGGAEVADTSEAAASGADFIQESGPEILEAKRELLMRIAPAVGPRTVIASSTSTFMPSQLQAGLPFAARVVIGHPFNPPELMPLVEVVPGPETAPETVERAAAFYGGLGKTTVRLLRERPGHLANRLQAALWREAVDAVASGAATVADVDAAVTAALGPRWAVMGPFASLHLGGGEGGLAHFLDHIGPAFEALWDDAQRPVMDAALRARLSRETEAAVGGRSAADLAAERDARLKAVLAARGF